MKILVIGGTRFFGIHTVNELLNNGHDVTIATRGQAPDSFAHRVSRVSLERTDPKSMEKALKDKYFDVVIDKIAYCSNDIKYALDVLHCEQYIHMSSTAVYSPKHLDTKEKEFTGLEQPTIWCSRNDFPYDEIKRQAEYALWQTSPHFNTIAVRYPFVIGQDDYTNRLLFYIENTLKERPMNIDNLHAQMSFIRSDEAGRLMAFLVGKSLTGPINGSSNGTISIGEILDYIKLKTGKEAIITPSGIIAPYNGEVEYSINTDRAKSLGFEFTNLKDWIFDLIDYYIEQVTRSSSI